MSGQISFEVLMQACDTSLIPRKLNKAIPFAALKSPDPAGDAKAAREIDVLLGEKYGPTEAFPERRLRHKIAYQCSRALEFRIPRNSACSLWPGDFHARFD
jgi:hypothetical protein